jgi:hypothetical protein
VTAEALGYHSAYPVTNRANSVTLQTFIYTSWLDPALVDPIIGDVSFLSEGMKNKLSISKRPPQVQ